jgi:hypothetical protein
VSDGASLHDSQKNTNTGTNIANKERNTILHKKKRIDIELYCIYIPNANAWKCAWKNTEQTINQKPQDEMKIIHEQKCAIYRNYKHKKTHELKPVIILQ